MLSLRSGAWPPVYGGTLFSSAVRKLCTFTHLTQGRAALLAVGGKIDPEGQRSRFLLLIPHPY